MAEEQGQAPAQPEQSVLSRLTSFVDPPPPEEEKDPPAQEDTAEQPEEAEAEAEEAPAEEESQGVEVDPDAPLVEITVKGDDGSEDTRLWSLDEMRKGVMMEKDYRRKTAEVARARETLDTEVQQQVQEARNTYVQGLKAAEQTLLALVVPELNGIDMDKLAEENPALAVKFQAKAQKLNNAVHNIRQQLAQADQQAMQQMAQQSIRALSDPVSGIPGWGDEVYSSIIKEGAKTYGFKPEEVANVVDHRMIRVMHDALKYRQATQVKPVPKQSPKVLKPGAPQGRDDQRAREATNLRQRLKKSGDIKDAAAAWLAQQERG
jgi:hypothetical protein